MTVLGLLPSTFVRLTPRELALLARWAERDKRQLEHRLAWQTAYIVSAISGKTITPEQLLGTEETVDIEEKVAAVRRAQAEQNGQDPAEGTGRALSPGEKLELLMGG